MRTRTWLASLALFASCQPGLSEEFNRGQFELYCDGHGSRTGQAIRCLVEQDRKAGELLTAKYRKLLDVLNEREKAAKPEAKRSVQRAENTLKESQRAWSLYRKTHCQFHRMRTEQVEDANDAPRVEEAMCLMKSNLDRMEELDRLLLSDR